MTDQIKISFKGFTALDLSSAQKAVIPRRKPNYPGEETLLKGALEGLALVAPNRGPRIRGLVEMASGTPPRLTVAGGVPGASIMSTLPEWTVTLGLTGSAATGYAVGAGAGVYFWNKRPTGEIGLYGSVSVGMVTNVGASVGDQLAILFGPAPKVLAGDSITVSVDVGVEIFTFSGSLILDAPTVSTWPPKIDGTWTPKIIGIAISITAGFSALPVDISVMPGRTWIQPVV